jgi:hypothetical protein
MAFPGIHDGLFLPGKRRLPLSRKALNTVVSDQWSVFSSIALCIDFSAPDAIFRNSLKTDA